jgi:hypothetical protein
MIKKIGLATLCAASAFAMHNVELNINDKDLEIGIKLDMGQFSNSTEPNTVFIGGKFLHGDDDHSDIDDGDYVDTLDDYSELNFLMKRNISGTGFSIGLGMKVNYTKDFASVPLGAEVGYRLPFSSKIPMYIGGSIYYAPQVLTMQDGDNFLEFRFEFDAEVIKNGHAVAGYRKLDTNYDKSKGGDVVYNQSPYIGFRFAF